MRGRISLRLRRGTRALVVGAVLASGLLLPRGASADRPSTRFLYERGPGAESCPDEAGIRSAVAARLGFDPFRPSEATRIEASVRAEGTDLVGVVRAFDSHGAMKGERKLHAAKDSCDELSAAMAVTISILLDPHGVFAQEPARPAPPASLDPRDDPFHGDEPPPLPAPLSAPREPVHFRLGIDAIGSLGAAPSAAFGGSLLVGLGYRTWSIDLEGRADLPAEKLRGDGTGVRFGASGRGPSPRVDTWAGSSPVPW